MNKHNMKQVFKLTILLFCSLSSFAQRNTPPKKTVVYTKDAPFPIGPYSQAIKANGFVYLAGQIGADPVSRKIVAQNFEDELKQVMANIGAILKASKLDFNAVINTTVYLKDLKNFQKFNEIYSTYFKGTLPARTTVGVADLPGGASIEISVVAVDK